MTFLNDVFQMTFFKWHFSNDAQVCVVGSVAAAASAFMPLMSTFIQFTPDKFRCRVDQCDASDASQNYTFGLPDDGKFRTF